MPPLAALSSTAAYMADAWLSMHHRNQSALVHLCKRLWPANSDLNSSLYLLRHSSGRKVSLLWVENRH